MKLVECVPNFSEGRNRDIIDQIASAIKGTAGVDLLDVDPGMDTNRTVYTFVGEPDAVVNAAFNAIKIGSSLIDMRNHSGAHPRMGACDVCPFIPVSDISMDDCVELAKRLGKMVGEQLGIPVYLYEFAASSEYRKNLADIRSGEYESLPAKLNDPEWKPDFGPSIFDQNVTRSGATVIGAREFLIAYNLNLNSREKSHANNIAKKIREKGDIKKNPDGTQTVIPGKFKECKAIGWYVEDYKRAQISINLTNFHVTNMQHVFDEAAKEAEKIGVRITGSEIVGLVPLQAIKEAGLHYIKKQGLSRAVSEREVIDIAIYSLGLSDVQPFNPDEKIIEYKIKKSGRLIDLRLTEFLDELASKSPAPGGGSVSALNGSIAASLGCMVGNLTFKKKGYENVGDEIEKIAFDLNSIRMEFLNLIDKDTESFNQLMTALKTKDPVTIEEATKNACQIPLTTAGLALKTVDLLMRTAQIGNINAISDVGVGCLNLYTSFYGAKYNVLINLKSISDNNFKQDKIKYLQEIENQLIPKLDLIQKTVEGKMV